MRLGHSDVAAVLHGGAAPRRSGCGRGHLSERNLHMNQLIRPANDYKWEFTSPSGESIVLRVIKSDQSSAVVYRKDGTFYRSHASLPRNVWVQVMDGVKLCYFRAKNGYKVRIGMEESIQFQRLEPQLRLS